jgi:hypothetical protein
MRFLTPHLFKHQLGIGSSRELAQPYPENILKKQDFPLLINNTKKALKGAKRGKISLQTLLFVFVAPKKQKALKRELC